MTWSGVCTCMLYLYFVFCIFLFAFVFASVFVFVLMYVLSIAKFSCKGFAALQGGYAMSLQHCKGVMQWSVRGV